MKTLNEFDKVSIITISVLSLFVIPSTIHLSTINDFSDERFLVNIPTYFTRQSTHKIQNNKISKSTKELKRVDLELFLRFLVVFSETVSIRITHLQMKTGTNHSACIKYISLLEKLELIESVTHKSDKNMHITERGRNALKVLSSFLVNNTEIRHSTE